MSKEQKENDFEAFFRSWQDQWSAIFSDPQNSNMNNFTDPEKMAKMMQSWQKSWQEWQTQHANSTAREQSAPPTETPSTATPSTATSAASPDDSARLSDECLARLDRLEERLARIERALTKPNG